MATKSIVDEELQEKLGDENVEIDAADDLPNLIPLADTYLAENFNLMLIGWHGTGKSESVFQLAKKHNLKVKYFSCSTLDPYTDLVGVPVPKMDENGHEYLQMVRPREIDEAEFIFFDEFNRANPKTLNAIFEIIQFHSINGEKLPNLKCCWCAMNPPDQEYQVEEVDPALLDRFHVYIEMKPRPNIRWMEANGLPTAVAMALKTWWDEQDRKKRDFKSYISPRRLYMIGQVYMATQNAESLRGTLPPGGVFDVDKLRRMLEVALGKSKKKEGGFGMEAADFVNLPVGKILGKKQGIETYLRTHKDELETHTKLAETITNSQLGGESLIRQFSGIIDAMVPSVSEAMMTKIDDTRKQAMKRAYLDKKQVNPDWDVKNLDKLLSKIEV